MRLSGPILPKGSKRDIRKTASGARQPANYHEPGVIHDPGKCNAKDDQSNIPVCWPVEGLGSCIVKNREGDPEEKESEDTS